MTFVPSHSVVTADGAAPTATVYVLHGILGSGRNWRTLARKLARRVPQLRYVLVDLRNHGSSSGAPPPHTLASTADDLVALGDRIGHPDAVMGHSFGGKVALSYAERHGRRLRRVIVLDSRISALPPEPDNDVLRVIRALRRVPQPLESRQDLAPILAAEGLSDGLIAWMTTNLRRADDGMRWAFDLDAIEVMIEDYWHADLWSVLRGPPCPIDIVRAGRGDRWPEDVVRRLATDTHPAVRMQVLANAGHWLHADDPDGLVDLVAPGLEAVARQA